MQFAQGQKDAAITALAAAADAEDATDKSAITPGPLAPARELLGFMLLEAGRAKEALVAFDAVLKKEPNRFLAIYGAAQAAEAAKQTTRAKQLYVQLVAMCKEAPAGRPELAHARKMAN
jgi:Tfp pilus assembly protein PilF